VEGGGAGELGVEERELVVDEKVLEVEERGNQCFLYDGSLSDLPFTDLFVNYQKN